jgi:hypothetical protein
MGIKNKIAARKSKAKRDSTVSLSKKKEGFQTVDSPVDPILRLQRTIGNQAVQRLFKSGILQPKLKIGQPEDKYEHEADRVADIVMRMPEPKILRQTKEEEEEELVQPKPIAGQITPIVQRQFEPEEEEEEPIQTKGNSSSTAEATAGIESSINSLKGRGQPLPESTRSYFEPRFGCDFSGVRVHTGYKASNAARALNSKAFTIDNNIVFNSGNYSPNTEEGKNLLAHELTHALQQGAVTRFSPAGFSERDSQLTGIYSQIQRKAGSGPTEEESEEPGMIERFEPILQGILENDELRNKLVEILIEKFIPEKYKKIFDYLKKNEKLRKYLYEKAKETFLPESIKKIVDILEDNPQLRKYIIQKLVEKLPWEHFLIFLEKWILAPFISVENLNEKTKEFFFKHFPNITLAILLNEFRTGTGKKERVFDISHAVTKEVAKSSAVKEALKVFYQENTDVTQFKDLKPLIEYEYKFSPKGDEPYYNIPKSAIEHMKGFYKVVSEWNWVDLFMGGVFVNIVPGKNNELNIEVQNDIGRESLMLHAVPDLPESERKVPYRTTIQKFIFSIPYEPVLEAQETKDAAHIPTFPGKEETPPASKIVPIKLPIKPRKKFVKHIAVNLSKVKDLSWFIWAFGKDSLRKKFPRLKNKDDFKFSAGTATAKYNDGTKENFDVSGGAIKGGYATPRSPKNRPFKIFRKEGANYISSRGDPMPYASYFYKGYAFHGCGNLLKYICLDYPSHGCLHVNNSTMAKLHPYIKKSRKGRKEVTTVDIK